ncbi:MAG: hypothetical protein Q7S55_05045 [Nanoarchaeota archaeon]|nr:hypothetical protein [Nanoarchaeota archaeon]
MVLYKLSFAIFPVKDIYARSRDDIAAWLERYEQDPFEVAALSEKKLGIDDIVEVEKGELLFDFGGIAAGNEFAEVDFLPDFTAKIRLESLPHFPSYLTRVEERKEVNLYVIRTCNGILAPLSYVPRDVFEAFKKCDVSGHEERAEQHIERLNRAISGSDSFHVRPRVTRKGKLN